MRYKVEISMNPNYDDNVQKPYFWIIRSIDETKSDSDWCTVTAGWSKTPDNAWAEAANYCQDLTSI